MPRRKRLRAPVTVITRSGTPLPPAKPTPPSPPDPTLTAKDLEVKATLAQALYEQYGSYVQVAQLLQVQPSTVRQWIFRRVHRDGKITPEELIERLQQTDPLAIDRIQEGLLEADPVHGAEIGLKWLRGRGHLRTFTSTKHDGTLLPTELKVTFEIKQDVPRGQVVDGAVVGAPLALNAAPEAEEEA